ncbi:hypothetical protein CEXT_110091 [Caerostris extrusa]|uniref:Uncharacterized protein n=1 Tax=Caerostris extrusa TaxID=172846 RepID=A0AAV4U0L8_CAEEX|nr:hypothetical protein CEXT_110091 [Caerostris extrusa]
MRNYSPEILQRNAFRGDLDPTVWTEMFTMYGSSWDIMPSSNVSRQVLTFVSMDPKFRLKMDSRSVRASIEKTWGHSEKEEEIITVNFIQNQLSALISNQENISLAFDISIDSEIAWQNEFFKNICFRRRWGRHFAYLFSRSVYKKPACLSLAVFKVG